MQESQQPVEQQALAKEFVFTGDSGAMIAARDAIMHFLHDYCANEQEEIDILLALQEALVNAVLHGCHNDPGQIVRCLVEVDPSAITIVVKDPGPGFNTAASADSSEDGTNLTEHGRGIQLMRSLMDELSYHHGGSEIHLKKLRGVQH